MDEAAIKAGGERSFFTEDLAPYAWSNLVDTRIGSQEKMDLFSEALTKFAEAPQLPELFRTIFRAAFLPYRSPETLGLFLKEINHFDYSHPEELGNAYEYLLSIMSSQGDAGQFRTPRHIIDFMVDVLDPTKDDTILDPACGTGGFLVSSYNHILEKHDGKDDPNGTEKPLTPAERKKLTQNLAGYDIDPSMVRIAQVNMYLHQFKNPQIFQYDGLTSEERWNDKFDVILANPPFMSPKGGIKPHNKFGIQSNRAEVLFVDYIASHLKPTGRAAIVVPEGIIFQSGKAYKELRKNLVENGLYAVVSLPGGVFQPYSGVKTSILFLNKEIAKSKEEMAFIKISADGFDLGSTKRSVAQNDIPLALQNIKDFSTDVVVDSEIISLVSKSEISASGDYALSGERYKAAPHYANALWPMTSISDVCSIKTGKRDANHGNPAGEYHFFTCAKDHSYIDTYAFDAEAILVAGNGDVGAVKYFRGKFDAYQRTYVLKDFKNVLGKYLYFVLETKLRVYLDALKQGNTMPFIKLGMLQGFQFPLPPLEVQEQIVAELDRYSAIISGAKQIVENWKPFLDVSDEYEMVKLNQFCTIQNGFAFASGDMGEFKEGYLPVVKIGNVGADGTLNTDCKFHAYTPKLKNFLLGEGDIVIAMTGATVGKVATVSTGQFLLNQRVGKVELTNDTVNLDYLRIALQSSKFYSYCQATATGGAQGNISPSQILEFQVPLPPIDVQLEMSEIAKIESEKISSLRDLITTYESRIQAVIAKLWSE
jgi:type I restriction enzyme M protein